MAKSDNRDLLASAARLIDRARQHAPHYGIGFGGTGWCGLSTKEMQGLFKGTNTRIRERQLPAGVTGMALPSAVGDGHLIVVDPRADRADRTFTVRHELAHILADEVQHALYLTSEDTMSFSERRADLFAVADLTPTRWMEWVRGKRRPWKHVTLDVVQAYRELTEGWSEQRLWDRARLRVQLFREFGV